MPTGQTDQGSSPVETPSDTPEQCAPGFFHVVANEISF